MTATTPRPARRGRPVRVELDRSELVRAYLDDGTPVTDMAARLGVDTCTVHRALRAAGVPASRAPARVDRGEALRLYVEDHRTVAEVAEALGCSCAAVYRVLRAAGVSPRGSRGRYRTGTDVATVLRLRRTGMTYRAVARRAGCSQGTARRIVRIHGTLLDLDPLRVDLDAVVRDHASGLSLRAVGAKHGVSAQVVRSRLRAAGVDTSRRRGRS